MGATYLTLKDLNEQRRKTLMVIIFNLQLQLLLLGFMLFHNYFDDVHHLDIKSCCYMISSLCERATTTTPFQRGLAHEEDKNR